VRISTVRGLLAAICATVVVVAGCGAAAAPSGLPLCGEHVSGPCRDWAPTAELRTPVGQGHGLGGNCDRAGFSVDRCQALAFAAARKLGLAFDQIVSVDVVANPDPPPGGFDFANRTFLDIRVADGRELDATIACPGIDAASVPECMPEPAVPVGSVDRGGYGDTPEGATPLPSLDPEAVANAKALRVPELAIPVERTGPQLIRLGTALLPNGYLTEATISLADPWPSSVLFEDGILMLLRPSTGGEPIRNEYETGWHQGTFEVDVTLTFDVAWFEPGTSFTLVDIVVR
jgi:hypothetical protein